MTMARTVNSMTGFAAGQGADGPWSWSWELRSVNGKGLDLRLRVPDWIAGLETALRTRLSGALVRGNVSLTLRVQSGDAGGRLRINSAQLDDVLQALAEVEARAMERGLSLAPARPGDVLAVRGVLDVASDMADTEPLKAALCADFETVLTDFIAMRASEGAALHALLEAHLADIARLTDAAHAAAIARAPEMAAALTASLGRVMDGANGADPARVAQELALIAVKADVTEEIGRLHAHVAAARELLASGAPVGRKLDFLSQEFNREANTMCAKAQNTDLTAIGLELKVAVDQMREQVQNVE
ncbi:YicC/YloC family endoribonuclease [Roseovarius dicentrarchi]|uniref:YicC/YloC family endoribonuclease n=1 Tax=Roseovarius dicentrarchi TaxID=2250573 RepID=UPI001EEF95FE|nr:YicC/YloC family endoribonuclease [Roseovarius dicentrarchi]